MGEAPSRPAAALLVALLLLLFAELPGTWLFDQDETRYAEIGREMLASGDWLTPRLNGARYDEKPPVTYWANAAGLAVLGNRPYAARLPARLAALGTALLLAWAGGGWAAALLLAAPLPFALGRLDLTDGLLTLLLTAAFLALRRFLDAEPRSRASTAWAAALGAACGLAVLTKGLVGVVLPGIVLVAWAGILGRWRKVAEALLSPAPLACLAVAAPWFVLMERAHPGFNRYFLWDNHVLRFTSLEGLRDHGPWFPWAVLAGGFLPWLALLRWRGLRSDPEGLFLWLWILVVPAFFTFSRSTLIPYLLPAMPAAALLAAREASVPGGRRWVPAAAWTLVVLQAAAVVALPRFADRRSWHALAERAAAEAEGGALVVGYRCHANSFMLRLERPVPTVAHRGELGSGGDLPPALFWREPEFWARWDSGERVVALVRNRDRASFLARSKSPVRVLDERWGRFLAANHGGVR